MSLSQTILDAARDEVAKKNGYATWSAAMANLGMARHNQDVAALLAMDRQAEFFRWAYRNYTDDETGDWLLEEVTPDAFITKTITELELYNIWREGK